MPAPIELRGITRSFGALVAVDDVSLAVEAGEVLAVVGENGAGKTTLMNVASGLYRPDAGEVRIRGEAVRLLSPRDAIARGVAMVHQHFMLVPPLTVAENVVLGREPRRGPRFDREAAVREVDALARAHGLALDAAARVEDVGVGMQQRAEIVKALYRRAEVLILDEPTAMLTPSESAELLTVVRSLAGASKAVVLVSHRLKEVLAVADRIAVMRRGRLLAVTRPADTSATRLADLMVGAARFEPGPSAAPSVPGEVALSVRGLCATDDRGRRALSEVAFELARGEILGVAGVDGNGQAELVEVITGLRHADAGEVRVFGERVVGGSPRECRARGIAHVPEDRQRRGLVLDMTVAENLALGRHGSPPFARGALVDRGGRDERARALVAAFDVRPPDPERPARALSGGNQQKVILARELDQNPSVLVAVQPTRGLDVGATAMVHDRMRRARDAGVAVLLVSLDLDEVLALSDRVLVLHRGRAAAILPRAEADEATVGRWMLGPEAARA